MDNFYLRLNRKYKFKHRYEQCLLWTLLGACTASPVALSTGQTMGQLESWLHAAPAQIVGQTDIGKHKIVAVLNYKTHYAFTILLLLLNASIINWTAALTFSGLLKINLNFSAACNSWKYVGTFSLLIQILLKSSYNPHWK